ncbi:hypothetical protein Tco_0189285 [Tanacetum coccineum]
MDSVIPLGQKNTLAEYMILSGANNRPPILDKDLYDSWKCRMELYMQNREHGRMILKSKVVKIGILPRIVFVFARSRSVRVGIGSIGILTTMLESVENGPLIWPTVEENGVTRTKKYAELSAAEKIQADCDMKDNQAFSSTSLTKQERECKLYDAFDKFTHIKGETLHKYYLRFTQRGYINDMKHLQHENQSNFKLILIVLKLSSTKSKFVTNALMKDLHTTNFDQIYAYLEQHELHPNEVLSTQPVTESPLVDLGFVVPVFSLGDDPIDCLNKAMVFLTAVASSRFPSTNNQLRTSSNLRNQATIQEEEVLVVTSIRGNQVKVILVIVSRVMLLSSSGNKCKRDRKWLLNAITCQDFGKRFTPQQELSAEQAFWLRMSGPTSLPSNALLVKIEAPKELPKISLVNESLKNLKFHLAKFDNVVKNEGLHLKLDLLNEIMEVKTVFDQMDVAVQQSSVDKQCLEIAKKELLLENDLLLKQIMSQDVL